MRDYFSSDYPHVRTGLPGEQTPAKLQTGIALQPVERNSVQTPPAKQDKYAREDTMMEGRI